MEEEQPKKFPKQGTDNLIFICIFVIYKSALSV